MIAVSGQADVTGPDEEMCADLLCQTEKLVDIAFPVPDMYASRRVAEEFSGLAKTVQPSNGFFLSIGTRAGLTFLFSTAVLYELLPGPEVDGRKAER